MRKILQFLSMLMMPACGLFAQVTTSSINGIVVDQKDEVLPGSTIIAEHLPSGTQYGTLARVDGRFTIPNARVGGPYKITVTFIGYEAQEKTDVYLSLGNVSNVDFKLTEAGTQLEEVVVSAYKSDVFNDDRTGAATNVDNRTIQSVPTISRGLKDFTKLSPLANTSGNGTSFAGASNRYNQFAIDGLVSNDVSDSPHQVQTEARPV